MSGPIFCPGGLCLGDFCPRGSLSQGVSVQGVSVWEISVSGCFCIRGSLSQRLMAASAASGTHPTGMHSSLKISLIYSDEFEKKILKIQEWNKETPVQFATTITSYSLVVVQIIKYN